MAILLVVYLFIFCRRPVTEHDIAFLDSLGTRRNPLRGYLQLIGVSRKSFLGSILAQGPDGRETTPKERTWATAAAVTCAVQQKAAVVRVHDVKEMADVVRVAGALWL